MSKLNQIKRGKQPMPPRLVLYGTEGIGKTTLASQAPAPVFIPTEDGLGEIETDRFPLAQTLGEFEAALLTLINEKHEYQTVVIDSLDWLERLIHDDLCREYGVTGIEKVDGGYGKGYSHALTSWRRLLSLLDRLRTEYGTIVIGIAHAKIERFEDPESSSYDRYAPRLNKHAAALITEWADAVLFATRKVRVQTEDAGFGRRRGVAHALGRDGGDRIIRTTGGPACVAKNRYGLPEELPLSWAALMAALTQKS